MSNPISDRPITVDSPADPLASLHKMSRTAGAGTQEYVAINTTSVAALLLGLASILAMVGAILLIVPVVAILVSVIALRQIRNSGGTQSGTGLAVAGIILAMAFVGFVGGKQLLDARHEHIETQQIVALMEGLGKDLHDRNYDAAWAKFGPRFKEELKREEFDTVWNRAQDSSYYGQIKGIRWNQVPIAFSWEADEPFGQGIFLVDLERGGTDRRMAIFHKLPDQGWAIDGIEGYFSTPESKPPSR
ncbi:MAG TPA: DUF4190 domain-containing protein [Tepidisphaeraceae bacterium]|nr:DUF4190 domain-containing protein [Tepidisphaeraceae bacterium]